MLSRLYIENIALIDRADVFFDGGLNVLSGETGAGKSVLLDSINFVLGSKADKSMIRFGETTAMVRAEFSEESDSPALKALRELDIDSDGTIIITRKFSSDGKGNIKINGNTVTASMLKTVTVHLVDVHGQSEHFFLLNEDNQLKVIDRLCGESGEKIKSDLCGLLQKKRILKQKIAECGGDAQERERKLDLLSYQIDEIEKANVKEGEFERLKERQKLIANTEKILTALNAAKSLLCDDNGCADLISAATKQIGSISELSETYDSVYDRLENLGVEAEDIGECLVDLAEELSFDESEAEFLEERLNTYKNLKKKYGADESEILNFLSEAKAQYEFLTDSVQSIENLTKEIAVCDDKIYGLCRRLTDLRKEQSVKFCENVERQLKTLNIPHAKFSVDFAEYDRTNAKLNSGDGSDELRFVFSANKGEQLKPLNKIISGGEMSRFMLAVKTVLKDINGISTYIFDEIDAGISGFTATTVAEKFIDIAKYTQIIAVSHLPQVCAAGQSHYLIYKTEEDGKTVSKIRKSDKDGLIEEIIRLSGGKSDSFASRQHAEELIAQFEK